MTRALRDIVTSPDRRAQLEADGHWNSDRLIERVLEHARDGPDRLAIVDTGGAREVTYGALASDVLGLADHLLDIGVEPGDVVSVQMPNWYETVVIDLAILAVGAVLNPMLPIYRARELQHMLTVGEVGLLFTPETYRGFDHGALGQQLIEELDQPLHHIAVADPNDDPDAFRSRFGSSSALSGLPDRDPSEVSELIFTSGTEAQPKAIMHTEQTASFGVRAAASALGLDHADDVVWMPSPIGHSTGFNYGVRLALHHGLPVVLQDQWSAADAVSLIERFRCTYTIAATTFVSDLVTHADEFGADLSSMRRLGSGGAPVPSEVVHGAARFGATVLRMYGSTEALSVTWNRAESTLEHRLATDGKPLDGVEIETRDDAGVPVSGAPGEIFVRSPCGAVGFFDDDERTAATWDDAGWIRSGDLGLIDDEGYLSIVGRKKEIIIRGGLNIAPREIEDVILQHPVVSEVAVIGLPDDRLGEKACACVVVKEGPALELDQLVAFLREQGMATFKLPQRLVLVDELPKTPTGKVQKQVLVARLS